jgi:hypothetical protein
MRKLLQIVLTGAAVFAAIPQEAVIAKGFVLVKGKDLSRLPVQPSSPIGAASHGIWEDAEVPSDGRGFDPLPTNSSDGLGRMPVARAAGGLDVSKPQPPRSAEESVKDSARD